MKDQLYFKAFTTNGVFGEGKWQNGSSTNIIESLYGLGRQAKNL